MHLSVAIIGAGASGLCAAIQLKKKLGLTSFTIYEKSPDLGGTWFDNKYPGCACDVASHLYSYSFELNPDWSQAFSPADEIREYFASVARKYGLIEHIRFRTEVVSARWDAEQNLWRLKLNIAGDNGVIKEVDATANILLSGVGGLNRPYYPEIPGLNDFKGPTLHTAMWDRDVSLKGKRVGVIGNAASGAQLIPELVPITEKLVVFQRTPNWVLPRNNYEHPNFLKIIFRYIPGVQTLWRTILFARRDLLFGLGAFRPGGIISKYATAQFAKLMKDQIKDPELQKKLIPNYAVGCKRVVLSSDYLPAIQDPKTVLVTDPISRIDEYGVVTADGNRHDVDALVLATGFVTQDPIGHIDVEGRDGLKLKARWGNDAEAYLGMTVSGFPNFYVILGPHSGLGHSSVLTMIECQVNYIVQMISTQLATKTLAVEVRPEALQAFTEKIYKAMETTTWNAGGCRSWYKNRSGKVTALWPHTVFWYWVQTFRPKYRDFKPVMKPPRSIVYHILTVILAIGLLRRYTLEKIAGYWISY
ncbi:hypothetical protein SpCBS45565_g07325 [Spizellomyces sp. 'palustris']|nr:hypothetical protein SpCBS45565_g07325 [Spizellomyces sp. 'palustris']